MEHIIRALGFAFIPIIVHGILAYLHQPNAVEKGKVHLPKLFAILGSIGSVLFLTPGIIIAFVAPVRMLVPALCFILLSLLPLSLVIGFINCRITYDTERFTAKNFLGLKRTYTYEQITGILVAADETYLFLGKHSVMVDKLAIGGSDFIWFAQKQYKALNGKYIPRTPSCKKDIFKGNVKSTRKYYLLFSLISICFIMIVAIFGSTVFAPHTPDSTTEHSVCFTSCTVLEEEMILHAPGKPVFKIRFTDEDFDREKIQSICDGKTTVTTYSEEITPDHSEDYYSIQAIKHQDTYLLTFKETKQMELQGSLPLLLLISPMLLFFPGFCIASIIVGRNPQKFSKKVVNLFFKDEDLNC